MCVVDLAGEIWHQHYTAIIGAEQVEYMLEQFQSLRAISNQLTQGQEYFIIKDGPTEIGYFSLIHDNADKSTMLSKIYVRKSERGKGHGLRALLWAEAHCWKQGRERLWLAVNKHNTDAIAWYAQMGFRKTGTRVEPIGNGFVMDDFVMEQSLRTAG